LLHAQFEACTFETTAIRTLADVGRSGGFQFLNLGDLAL